SREIDYYKNLSSVLESYKFEYDPNTIKYEDCSIQQLMYIMYVKYGPDKEWETYYTGGKCSVYERHYYNYWTQTNHVMNDDEYRVFLVNNFLEPKDKITNNSL